MSVVLPRGVLSTTDMGSLSREVTPPCGVLSVAVMSGLDREVTPQGGAFCRSTCRFDKLRVRLCFDGLITPRKIEGRLTRSPALRLSKGISRQVGRGVKLSGLYSP